jgi:hypothetical protein
VAWTTQRAASAKLALVLRQARDHIDATLPADAAVLQVGGAAELLARADWVLAETAYEARERAEGRERFARRTWLVRDLSARDPWPFADGQFAFAVCTELATVRDPVGVCRELTRVARAGYVEVPTIEDELAAGLEGPWLGRSAHRWLCDVVDGALVFTAKSAALEADARVRVQRRWHDRLEDVERVHGLLWEDTLPARERLVAADVLADELAVRVQRRFEPSAAEVALREARDRARKLTDLAGGAVGRGIGALRGER